ncbi:MAG TPA: UbiX family flavin prenyltransferase [Tenuifilaceae bacterium]|nr:UbiX family flavin prenyltransferase [Tenuifilaceae bacterium]
MQPKKRKIIVSVTGASGSIYAKLLIEELYKLSDSISEIALIFSENGQKVWEYELETIPEFKFPVKVYRNNDMFAPVASGSSRYDTMIVIPCTMGTLGRIASGISSDLIERAADVTLKERRQLILVPRELPLNLIHIENMRTVTLAGGIIIPASPSFYSLPKSIEQLALTVVHRIMDIAGFTTDHYRWDNSD